MKLKALGVVSNGKVQDKAGFGLHYLFVLYLIHRSHTYHKSSQSAYCCAYLMSRQGLN